MTKFKVGDRVRVIDLDGGLPDEYLNKIVFILRDRKSVV